MALDLLSGLVSFSMNLMMVKEKNGKKKLNEKLILKKKKNWKILMFVTFSIDPRSIKKTAYNLFIILLKICKPN